MSQTVIAIDGPAASGKSSVARLLAARLRFTYVNTGEMYRAVTWLLIREQIPLDNAETVTNHLNSVDFQVMIQGGKTVLRLNGEDVTDHVRDATVNDKVSVVAALPGVRGFLVARQQELAESVPLVMEGRDIGTVVFPQSPHKFFIDADPEVRARRRARQGEHDSVAKRDKIDSSRMSSPLKCADDAVRIDSSHLGVEEIVVQIIALLKDRGLPAAAHPASSHL